MKRPAIVIACRNNPDSPGGIEAVVRELLPRLQEKNPQWNVRAVWAFEGQAGLARVPLIGDLLAAVRIAWRARDARLVMIHGAEYAWPFLRRRQSTIVVWHGTRAAEVPNLVPRMSFPVRVYWQIEKLLQRAALACAKHVAVAPTVVNEIRTAYGYRGEVSVIVNGGGENACPDRMHASTHEFRVLWVGVQSYKKGWDIALEACRIARQSVPQLRLAAAGLRSARPDEDWIDWLGPIPRHRVLEEYGRADVLLGTTRYEACSMAVIEALSHGVPVVASPAIAWMLKDGGVRIEAETPESFARALAKLAGDSSQLHAFSRAAARDALQFSWDDAAERYGAIIAQLFERRSDDSAHRAAS